MSAGFADATVAVPGGSVFTRRWEAGQGDRAPIILLHDSLGCVELWREFPASLARAAGRPVVAYDRPGYGRSTPRTALPPGEFIREEAETILAAVADALGISRYLLFGHSTGGGIALVHAALNPGRCGAVITEAAQAFVEERTLDGVRAAKTEFGDPAQFAKLARWHGDRARWVLDAWTETWLSEAFRSWTLDPWLPLVRCPVLAIHGELDEFGSAESPRRIAGMVSGPSALEILPGCGHVPHRERGEDVLRLTTAFIDQYSTGGSTPNAQHHETNQMANDDKSFVTSRFFPHAPEEVFGAFADPRRLARWWGPKGFSNEFEVFEFREGGRWVFTMIGPDGSRHPNSSRFTRIVAGSAVVVSHDSPPQFTLTVTTTPAAGGTTVGWRQEFADPVVAEKLSGVVVVANEQNLDRLGAELAGAVGG